MLLPGRLTASLRPSDLLERGKAAMEQHRAALGATDRIAIADFSLLSAIPRFHLVDLEAGKAQTILVAHGRGSDPDHRGWLQSFSNLPGSYATSAGAYVTGTEYVGQHGRSVRLEGLDPSNCYAAQRAIVVHGAWYVDEDLIRQHGKIGRSEGCFAVSQAAMARVIDFLGVGRLIYADR